MTTYPTRAGVEDADVLEFEERRITISTTVQYRGRQLVITCEGYTADEFVTVLDKRFGPAQPAPNGKEHSGPEPLTSPPLCPVHKREMRPMKYPSKQGHMWHCTAKVADGWCDERA